MERGWRVRQVRQQHFPIKYPIYLELVTFSSLMFHEQLRNQFMRRAIQECYHMSRIFLMLQNKEKGVQGDSGSASTASLLSRVVILPFGADNNAFVKTQGNSQALPPGDTRNTSCACRGEEANACMWSPVPRERVRSEIIADDAQVSDMHLNLPHLCNARRYARPTSQDRDARILRTGGLDTSVAKSNDVGPKPLEYGGCQTVKGQACRSQRGGYG